MRDMGAAQRKRDARDSTETSVNLARGKSRKRISVPHDAADSDGLEQATNDRERSALASYDQRF